ncbi:MAG: hypothetical protein HFI37_08685 [Lachnospiraceae bacterium]|nr:hypothetical protein [Lachnospiraceae bacterium]
MKKRILALIMAVCVTSTSVSITALAEEAGNPVKPEEETVMPTEKEQPEEPQIQEEPQAEPELNLPEDGKLQENKNTEQEDTQKDTDSEEIDKKDIEEDGTKKDRTEEEGEIEKPEDIEIPEEEEEAPLAPWERMGSLQKPEGMQLSEEEAAQVQEVDLNKAAEQKASARYNSQWDIYSSNYIYNRLNQFERTFWDGLDYICRYYMENSVDAVDWDDSMARAALAVDFSQVGLSRTRAAELYWMFSYANPQYYFLYNGYLYTSEEMIPGIYAEFQSGSARSAATAAVKQQVDAWEREIAAGSTEAAKAKIAHDLVIKKVQYDDNYGTSSEDNPFHQSAYSVFADDHTVCAGYTKAFAMLMNGAGVDTMGVTSRDHAWNIININDSWYYVDCTWDDYDGYAGYELGYEFFNRNRSNLLSMSGGQGESHVEESYYSGVLPACTLDSGATRTNPGTCRTPSSRTGTPSISLKAVKGGVQVTIKPSTSGSEIYYTLNGTNPSSSFTKSYLYRGTFKVSSNTSIKAMAVRNTFWDSVVSTKTTDGKSYKVTFKSNKGSSVSAQYVLRNAKAKKPKNPTRKGYVFGGWYTDSKLKKSYSFSTKVTGNKTLYAKWLKKYTVKFNANKGSVKTKSKGVGYGGKYGTLPSPTRKGYSFAGWYTKASGGSKITESSKVKIKKTTTFYAHWKKISVKKTVISKLENVKGLKLKATAKKVSGAKGYQIRYSLKSNMKSAKVTSVKGKTAVTASKLKKGKKYYVQIRAYKIDSANKKVYGGWSKTKSIKIKK